MVAWSNVYEGTRELWEEGNILLVKGKVRMRNDKAQLNADEVAIYRPEAVQIIKEAVTAPLPAAPPVRKAKIAVKSASPWQRVIASKAKQSVPTEPSPPPPAPVQTHRLVISLAQSADEEQDLARLYKLNEIIKNFAGKDEVILILGSNGKTEKLRLPGARYCPELHKQLIELLGEGGLGVENLG